MSIEAGRRLQHYLLETRIGEGAMGVVWQARDTALDRAVAIKLLPEGLADDPARLARFEREARLLASLSHPNIATIHGLHEQDGLRFLAMELVPGQDLAERLERGSLPLDEALGYARQIAGALMSAHAAGVVHRDLKPANVRITPEGQVRVLDFGLAKALDPGSLAGSAPGATTGSGPADRTRTSMGTIAGVVLGTAAYMSPEQARGRPVDRRTDVWAFGCVLYEMLTGRPAFPGDTVSDILAGVLRAEPDLAALPASTPGPIRRLLRRCLQKDVDRRLHDLGDACLEITDALDPAVDDRDRSARGGPSALGGPRRFAWVLAAGLAGLAFAAGMFLGRGSEPAAGPGSGLHLSVSLPDDLVLYSGAVGGRRMAVAPDGSCIAFTARKEDTIGLYVRALDSDTIVAVPDSQDASSPFFSPDGRWVGFFGGGKLQKVAVSGGTPIAVAESRSSRGGVWLEDDSIVFAPDFSSGLARVPASGGDPVPLTTLDPGRNERTHRWPAALPGGRGVLFTIGTLDSPGSYDDAVIAKVDFETGVVSRLVEGAGMAEFADGRLYYARRGDILSVPFDPRSSSVSAAPVVALKGVDGEPTSGNADFMFTRAGALVYMPARPAADEPELVMFDRGGRAERLPFSGRGVLAPALSRDGRHLAVTVGPGLGDGDIWIYDLEARRNTRLTFHGSGAQPVWSPDGRRVAYGYTRGGEEGVLAQPVDGSAEPQQLATWPNWAVLFPNAWDRDSGTMLLSLYGGRGGSDVVALDPGATDVVTVLDGPAAESGADFAPGGRWFAYVSDESGRFEVYVRPYPGPGGKFQISSGGGKGPRWSRDGREIFYTVGDRLMSAPVETEPTFSAGAPRLLFRTEIRRELGGMNDYDVSADGQRFYVFRRSPETVEARRVDIRFGFTRAPPAS